MPDDNDLSFGLYERLVTAGLKAQLLRFDPASTRVVTQELQPTEAHVALARHIEDVVARALADLPHDRAARQSQLANQIISLLSNKPTEARFHEDLVENPPEQLQAIQPVSGVPNRQDIVAPLGAFRVGPTGQCPPRAGPGPRTVTRDPVCRCHRPALRLHPLARAAVARRPARKDTSGRADQCA
jgi:hypothetical protein